MSGLKNTNDLKPAEVLAAVRALPPGQDYVWDGVDEDDRPATAEELSQAVRRGRPPVAVARPMLSMRVDPDVLAKLRASGKGWQTKVNALLREAVASGRL